MTLRVQGLVKRYGERKALDAVSLTLAAKSFVVLLGPNGAGKSTLFQLLTGLFVADAGEVEVAGHSMRHAATPRAAPHRRGVPADVARPRPQRARQPALPCRPARPAARRGRRAHRTSAARALGLGADLDRAARELSGGNRRKVELVRALLHRPSVLLMDEATVGLDPKSRRDLLAALHADVARARRLRAVGHPPGRGGQPGRPRAGAAPRRAAGRRHAGRGHAALGGDTLEAGFIARTAMTATTRSSPHDDRRSIVQLGSSPWPCASPPPSAQAQVAYVSSEKDHALTLIDLQDARPSRARADLQAAAPHAAHARRQALMVACTESNAADVIDPATRQVAAPHAAGRRPRGVRPLARRQDAVRLQRGRRRAVSFIDVASGKMLRKSSRSARSPKA